MLHSKKGLRTIVMYSPHNSQLRIPFFEFVDVYSQKGAGFYRPHTQTGSSLFPATIILLINFSDLNHIPAGFAGFLCQVRGAGPIRVCDGCLCLISTLSCKAYKSIQSIRKHLIFQTQTKKLVVDSSCIMFRVAYGADDLNGRIYR